MFAFLLSHPFGRIVLFCWLAFLYWGGPFSKYYVHHLNSSKTTRVKNNKLKMVKKRKSEKNFGLKGRMAKEG